MSLLPTASNEISNTWSAVPTLGWCTTHSGQPEFRLLQSYLHSVPDLAPPLPCPVRGTLRPLAQNTKGHLSPSYVDSTVDRFKQNVLYDVIQEIASLWSNEEDKNRYQAAAAAFRIPYWDWAADPPEGESVLPRSTWESQVIDADGPNGVQQISNPLFAYNFHPLDTKGFPFSPVR